VGRTGRAGNKGTAVTFVDWDDMPRWGLINKALGLSVPEPIETYSSSPHLYEDLDIPEGTKGRLPRDKRTLAGVDAEVLEDLGETGKKNSRGGRDAGSSRERGGREAGSSRDSRDRGAKREGGRSSDSAARSGERRRRTPEAAAAPAAAGDAPAAAGAEQPSRTRRPRTRTRRRNGEVVGGGNAAQPGSTEA
jgi:superfamily II DNA/RNA helicase